MNRANAFNTIPSRSFLLSKACVFLPDVQNASPVIDIAITVIFVRNSMYRCMHFQEHEKHAIMNRLHLLPSESAFSRSLFTKYPIADTTESTKLAKHNDPKFFVNAHLQACSDREALFSPLILC